MEVAVKLAFLVAGASSTCAAASTVCSIALAELEGFVKGVSDGLEGLGELAMGDRF